MAKHKPGKPASKLWIRKNHRSRQTTLSLKRNKIIWHDLSNKVNSGSCMMKVCVLWVRRFPSQLFFHEHRVCAVLVWQRCLRIDKKLSRKKLRKRKYSSQSLYLFVTVNTGNFVFFLHFKLTSEKNVLVISPHQRNLCFLKEKSYLRLKQVCHKQQWKSPLSSKYCTLVKYCKCRYSGRLYQILPSAFLLFLNSYRSSKTAL